MKPSSEITRLVEIMAALRDPISGCPWDRVQTFATIAPYTIEEAYEVADAIQRGDLAGLKDELGDLLLQVAYHARLAEELGAFALGDVVTAITAKMIRRHPHVFGDKAADAAEVRRSWDEIKAAERSAAGTPPGGVLDGVPLALPGLTRAVKLQERAGKVGFDWNDPAAVLAKIREELAETEAEIAMRPENAERLQDEVGDILFAVANLARHLRVDPEAALRSTNGKFERRFAFIERRLAAAGRSPKEASLDEMEALWQAAKAEEASLSATPPEA